MCPDRVSNPGPLTYESGALLIALRGPATSTLGQTELQLLVFLSVQTEEPYSFTYICSTMIVLKGYYFQKKLIQYSPNIFSP